jgi:predicted O-methyltransferase YrrM
VLSSPSTTFDIIYIDEPDAYDVKEYLTMCRQLAHSNTIIILNNVVNNSEYKREWNLAPTNAWKDAIEQGVITEIHHIDYTIGRGMAWGKYIFHDKNETLCDP